MADLTGRCACGAVTYAVTGAPLFTQACHCRDCQKTTGTAFIVHAVMVEDDLKVSGETSMSVVPSGSGAGCELHACAKCAGYIWARYRYHQVPVIALRVGTLDDPSAFPPEAHIFLKSKQPWLSLMDGKPRFEEGVAREAVWPPESVARYNALPKRA